MVRKLRPILQSHVKVVAVLGTVGKLEGLIVASFC
jgi:hypothetical protein